jgi:hypothetical protein
MGQNGKVTPPEVAEFLCFQTHIGLTNAVLRWWNSHRSMNSCTAGSKKTLLKKAKHQNHLIRKQFQNGGFFYYLCSWQMATWNNLNRMKLWLNLSSSNSRVSKCPAEFLPEYAFIGRSMLANRPWLNMLATIKILRKPQGPGRAVNQSL